ncbi:glycine--tRNA ligase beta subunit [Paraliobacillus quinghaiensis]|uniref:Glycine--tRNA ligase beta subunit n=1 Tax=Paraliobacillus quinghaiensis TaxID=470815 RepID=A0A917WUL0_9BACI|nr:glycine--tRNA ligase subunit beta [Paraliobacillus quinghaiensis]GGM31353.1 glycine--tRNA ligase beta subunit [Paraliobacillus quinghaiensis]
MKTTNILFEIGLEEMPARFLDDTEKQLHVKTIEWLDSVRLPYQKVETFVTPRRLAVVIEGLATKQEDMEEEARGPAKKIALDQEGNWSKAAIGFSKGQGKAADDIYFKTIKDTEYAFVKKYTEGKTADQLLSGFKDVILSLTFPKNMRWSNGSLRFIRPIRWLVALNDQTIIPFEIAGVKTSNQTYGHRFLGGKVVVDNPLNYEELLNSQYVIADAKKRKALIKEQIKELEKTNGWIIPEDQELLEEVSQLVEYPTAFFGSFSQEFLTIPKEALITSMKEHQRYFPVLNNEGELLQYFVAVRNGNDQHLNTVAKGNEKVLKARLSDAMFFYQEDQKQSIEQNLKKLERMVFQESLGTISDKVNRVVKLTSKLADLIGADNSTKENAVRAAQISKFDLVTNMVNEFTKLQGVMGEKYASLFGENEHVAKAINEHYMPRHANDALPQTTEGAIVSVADKLDTIIGCISVGIIPTGSQDPYALRRQAMGVLQILQDKNWSITIEELLNVTQDIHQPLEIATNTKEEVNQSVSAFFYARAAYILKEEGIEQDIIEAVLANGIANLTFTIEKAQLLAEKRQQDSFKPVQEAFVRVINLAKKGKDTGVNIDLFENKQEQELYERYEEIKKMFMKQIQLFEANEAMMSLEELTDSIHAFFDHTMVMTDNEAVKKNRISLLNQIESLMLEFADLSKIEWKQQFSS